MKALLLFFAFLLPTICPRAQKNVTETKQSAISGIILPTGSKHDKRMLVTASAKALLAIETENSGIKLKDDIEVLSLPVKWNDDSVKSNMKKAGWIITPVQGSTKATLVKKADSSLLMYIDISKRETSLYFSTIINSPVTGGQVVKQPLPPVITPTTKKPVTSATPPSGKYSFTTTNFDDGWTSTVKENWVEVVRGNITVLLHYPKEGTIMPADPEPLTNNAWNILVAPRYSNLKNYKVVSPSLDYERAYMGAGNLTDNATGKEVYVALFRKGNSGWLECIASDKNAFVKEFGADVNTINWDTSSDVWNVLKKMPSYNKFGVAAADFTGSWTSDFTGVQQMYNVYTGNYAGMKMNQSNEVFDFTTGGNYNWKLLVVNGMVGNAKFNQVKSSGKITVLNNWQVGFSDIEGKPRKYHAFFSCIKGARLLNLLSVDAPGSGIYTVYGQK